MKERKNNRMKKGSKMKERKKNIGEEEENIRR